MSKRDDINQAVLAGAPAFGKTVLPVTPREPVSHVGRMGQQITQGLAREVEVLKSEVDTLKAERLASRVILELDPKRVRFSAFAQRDETSFQLSDPSFRELFNSLRDDGQDDPIRVRLVTGEADVDYELVYGHRRLRVAQLLDHENADGFRVLAVLDGTADDLVTFAMRMHRENRLRSDPSPIEYGRWYRKLLSHEVFKSQRDLASAANLHESTLGQYLQLADLPDAVIHAFVDPRRIALRWSKELTKAYREDPEAVIARAQQIVAEGGDRQPDAIFNALITPTPSAHKRRASSTKAESIKVDNKVLFTLSRKEDRFSIRLGKHVDRKLARDLHEELKQFVLGRLTNRTPGNS